MMGGGLALAALTVVAAQSPSPRPGVPASVTSFAVYALSRGKGVPGEARQAVQKVRDLIEADRGRGLVVKVETRRIGLEGETRTCVEYKRPQDGTPAYRRARAIVTGVDLVNLVAEPCAPRASESPGKQE
jgi:hypothetical protein